MALLERTPVTLITRPTANETSWGDCHGCVTDQSLQPQELSGEKRSHPLSLQQGRAALGDKVSLCDVGEALVSSPPPGQ